MCPKGGRVRELMGRAPGGYSGLKRKKSQQRRPGNRTKELRSKIEIMNPGGKLRRRL